jgi:very-short-patch-repair endonuclease
LRNIHINARALRNGATDAERKLWQHLRGRQLFDYKFRRQYPIAGYIADFVCVEAKLVVELDGGQHLEQVEYDAERSRKLAINGYKVLRFWNDDVLLRTELVLEQICRELRPLPNPPLQAGEGAKSESQNA